MHFAELKSENKSVIQGDYFWLTFPWAGGGKINHISDWEDVGP